MIRRVALLRGVNVGGAGKLPMAGFRALLEDMGLSRVETLIQSGNAVFAGGGGAAGLEAAIRAAIAGRFGFAPEVFLRTADEMADAATDHPFAEAEPARVHVFFLRGPGKAPDEAALRALALPGDGWAMGPGRFTLHTPGGLGRSKLAEKLDRHLAGPMTARNLNTVARLAALAAG